LRTIIRHSSIVAILSITFRVCALGGTTGILTGTITDKEKHEGIIGVQVFLIGTMYGGVTDTNGAFHIGNIRAGVYDIRCSLVGYATIVVKNVTVLPDIRNRLHVEMEQSPVEMAAVEVTADQPMIQKDQPQTAFTVGEHKISALPVSTINDLLALQPSTTVEGNIRGGKSTDVLYMVDGLPMQDVISGGSGGLVPKSSISGMTVMTGGYDPEYGNALSGVVNVVTKTATDRPIILARGEMDNLFPGSISNQYDRYKEAELSASGPIVSGKLSYLSSNTYTQTDTRFWSDFDKYFSSPIAHEWNGLEKLEYAISPEERLSVQGVFDIHSWHDYEFSWRYNLEGLPPENRTSNRIAVLYSNMISSRTYYSVSISRYFLESQIGQGSANDVSLEPFQYDLFLKYIISGQENWWADTKQDIWTLKGDLTNESISSHFFKIGYELNQYNISSDVVKYEPQMTYFGKPILNAPELNYSDTYNYYPYSGGLYAQDKIQIDSGGSQASIGVRWDFLDPRAQRPVVEFIPTSQNQYNEQISASTNASFKQQFSPRIAVSTSVDSKTFLFANFGQYFQFPLFDYLYSGITPVQLQQGSKNVLTGNPDLQPEHTSQWEVGVKRSLDKNVMIAATYFYKNTENEVDSKTLVPFDSRLAGDFGFASYVNDASADANGLEIVLSRENDELFSGSISYTYMTTEGTSDYANQQLNIAQWGFPLAPVTFPLSWDQTHTLKIDLLSHLPFGIEGNVVLLYNSPRPYTYYPTKDGFTPLDSTKAFVPNNARMSDVLFLNLKLQKRIPLDYLNARFLSVYFDGRNILNRANVKWVDSNGRIGGELGDPSGYYDPRRARIGVTMEW